MPAPQKILLLGGSGFVGSRLMPRLLEAGHDVLIADIVRSGDYPARWRHCDIRNLHEVRAVCRDRDLIINLAAQHRDDVTPVSLYHEVNVEGSRNVCRVADEAGIRQILFTSSVAIYGFPEGEVAEDAQPRPFNEYGRTKLAAEGVYRGWLATNPAGRSLTIVRPTVIFGEGNRGNVYNLLHQIASGRFVMVGSGRNRKSMAYVENVAGFLQHCLDAPPGERVFNYVDKPDLDMNQLLAAVRTQLGRSPGALRLPYPLGWMAGLGFDLLALLLRRKFSISRIRVKKFCAETLFSSARAAGTSFQPPFALLDGLRRTVQHEFSR